MGWSTAMISISYPFTLDAFGKTNSTYRESKIYLDKLVTLLSTNIGQRPMLPEYGTDIATALFENDNDFVAAVRAAITTAVARWIPAITISSLEISTPDFDGYSSIILGIELPNDTTTSITVNSAIFGADGSVSRLG